MPNIYVYTQPSVILEIKTYFTITYIAKGTLMISVFTKMPDKDDWEHINLCIITNSNTLILHHMNHEKLMALFSQLVIADRSTSEGIELNFNKKTYKFTYKEWQSIYGAIDHLVSIFINKDPLHLFEPTA